MYYCLKHPTTGTLYAATSTVHDMYQSTYLVDTRINAGGGKVLFSTDNGSNWQLLHNFAHPVIWIALDPQNTDRMYASVAHSTLGGIFICENIQSGAQSVWTKVTNPPRTEGHPFNVLVLNDGAVVCSYSGRRTTNFTASSGVFLSNDKGQTWLDRSDAGMQYWTQDVVIDINDATQNTWFSCVYSGWGGNANNKGGLYRTANRGQSWVRVNDLTRVTSLSINPNKTNEAYLTTETDGLWISENINSSNPTFTRVDNYHFRQPQRLFFNPYNKDEIWVTSFGNGIRVGLYNAKDVKEYLKMILDDEVDVFPNPANDKITIRVNTPNLNVDAIEIYSVLGVKMLRIDYNFYKHDGTFSFPVSSLPVGTYLIKILTREGQFIKRISVVR